ncbi:hypothetical protein [Burkholderia sp. BC1]|uniref:hypothetical protein n=1 Tax=Burkholderia sp. BC1 TaxID=1095370 RepID=UPI004044A8CC
MSIYTMERVLWDLHTDPAKVKRFHSDAGEFLSAYLLAEEERALLESLDVRAIADKGVSQMLLFCSWQAIQGGPPSIPEYMRRMNTR